MLRHAFATLEEEYTEGCMGEQASLEFYLTFGDVLHHKLIQAFCFQFFKI